MIATPLDCDDVVKQIWDWLDNELPDDRWAAIENHLATCTGCSEHVAFARSFLSKIAEPNSAASDVSTLKERIRTALKNQSR